MFRELDDALLDLRVNQQDVGLVMVRTEGKIADIVAYDNLLLEHRDHWLVAEIIQLMSRTLQRMERTSCSFFALIDEGTCFAGSLLDLAFACDRLYMLDEPGVEVARSPFNEGLLPMTSGISRSACRLLGEPKLEQSLQGDYDPKDAEAADMGNGQA